MSGVPDHERQPPPTVGITAASALRRAPGSPNQKPRGGARPSVCERALPAMLPCAHI